LIVGRERQRPLEVGARRRRAAAGGGGEAGQEVAEGAVRAGAVDIWVGVWLAVVSYALEKIVTKEWKPGDAAVGLVIEAAWEAIGA